MATLSLVSTLNFSLLLYLFFLLSLLEQALLLFTEVAFSAFSAALVVIALLVTAPATWGQIPPYSCHFFSLSFSLLLFLQYLSKSVLHSYHCSMLVGGLSASISFLPIIPFIPLFVIEHFGH